MLRKGRRAEWADVMLLGNFSDETRGLNKFTVMLCDICLPI